MHTVIQPQLQWRCTTALSAPDFYIPPLHSVLPFYSFHSLPQATSVSVFFSPLKFYLCSNITNGSIHNVIFWVWLFGTVHLRFIHYYMFCYFVPFLLVSSVLLNGFTSLFTIFPIEGHLDYWQFWVIMNETAKYICTQTCVWAQAFISFG